MWLNLGIKSHSNIFPLSSSFIPTLLLSLMVDEANELKKKGAVSVVDHLDGEYISSYFAVPKPRSPGKFRPILNLKYFNKCVKKYKFKMETLASVREWIREGSFCTGLDLKDAYPHIGMHESSKKYLRFAWLGSPTHSVGHVGHDVPRLELQF